MTAPTVEQTPDATTELAPETAEAQQAPEATEADPKPTNVIEAILAVMKDVRAVGKDSTNEQQRFNFRGIDAVVNAVGPQMRRHGLVVIPNLRSLHREVVEVGNNRSRMQHVQVEVEFRFYGPGGASDTITACTPGEAMDSGDKATAKAMSVSFRTALLQALALPTTERDPDADTYERSPAFDVTAFLTKVEEARHKPHPVAALSDIGNRYGEDVLANVQVPHPVNAGETINAAAFLHGWISRAQADQHAAAERAQAEAAQQAEEGPARDVRADESAGQPTDARAQEPAQQGAPAQEQHPAQQQENARQAEYARPGEEQARARLELYREEIRQQARVLGLPSALEHVGPFLRAQKVEKIADLPEVTLGAWVRAQRPRVADALQQSGNATAAAAMREANAKNLVATWAQLTGEDRAMAEDSADQEQQASTTA